MNPHEERYQALGASLRYPHPERPKFLTDLAAVLRRVEQLPDIPKPAVLAARLLARAAERETGFGELIDWPLERERQLLEASVEYLPLFAVLFSQTSDKKLLDEVVCRSYPTCDPAAAVDPTIGQRVESIFAAAGFTPVPLPDEASETKPKGRSTRGSKKPQLPDSVNGMKTNVEAQLRTLAERGVKSVGQILAHLEEPEGKDLRDLVDEILVKTPTKKGKRSKSRTRADVIQAGLQANRRNSATS